MSAQRARLIRPELIALVAISVLAGGCRMIFGRAPAQNFVAGVVSTRSAGMLPADADVQVVFEAMQPDSTYRTLRSIQIERRGRPFPIAYRIYYAADSIDNGTPYALRAVVSGRGVASPRVPVLTQGGGRSADLVLGDTARADPRRLRVAPPTPARLPTDATGPPNGER